ncbi:TAFII28-domain-containing protein [Suillus paluster]|uniref:TAFII28-domain-containing protein n=1 Tax=Suillus paluster TaxID=48578 RepID=UPI001B87F152|nr:TAFII28-domain-containing protein [Suillus paluster]KAG1744704.1 TAFII28-domain-containing protein [Suillus paluster]
MTTPYTPTSFIQMTHSTPATPTPAPAPTRGRGTGAKRGRQASRCTIRGLATPTPAMRFTRPNGPLRSPCKCHCHRLDIYCDCPCWVDGDDEPMATQPPPVTAATSSTDAITPQPATAARPAGAPDEDAEGEDELLPAMADDDYSAQLSWQSESKDNLKVLMDNFSPGQYERFEAYRRHALPKQAIRKVIQQTTGQQVSQPGVAKVFVGEIVEKARHVQSKRNDTGPLTPDHLREAYRMYQAETGRVGSARPTRGKRLFVR